jgi:hypothetical protein
MPSTLTLQNVLNLAATHAELIPLTNVGGYSQEPGLSICNDAVSEIINSDQDWKFNSVELGSVSQPLITMMNKQDYLFAGASAFVLANGAGGSSTVPSSGVSIDLAGNSAITVVSGIVTVNTLETHRFAVGNTVYMTGNTATTGTPANYNSTFSDNGNQAVWSGGWVIIGITAKSFTFTAVSGQNNGDVAGAPGITNFGWLTGATMMELNNTSSPPNVRHLKARRTLPRWSRVANPEEVSVIQDLGTGVLKVRFSYVPGSVIWCVDLVYQAAAPIYVALTATWSPIPDSYGSVIRQAVMYRMYRYINSPKTDSEFQKLQAEIQRSRGRDNAEESDVYLEPEESLLDMPFTSY